MPALTMFITAQDFLDWWLDSSFVVKALQKQWDVLVQQNQQVVGNLRHFQNHKRTSAIRWCRTGHGACCIPVKEEELHNALSKELRPETFYISYHHVTVGTAA